MNARHVDSDHPAAQESSTGDDAAPMWMVAAETFMAWRDGDRAALEGLVGVLTPVLWQIVRSYGLDRSAAEDAVQVTWLTLVRKRDTIRDPQAVWRWMATTARRQAWRMSSQANKADPAEPVDLELLDLPEPAPGPEAHAMTNDTARRLWRHVASLPARCQLLLRNIAFEEKPNYAELSAQLGLTVGGIGPTRARCLDKLRRLLADDAGWSLR